MTRSAHLFTALGLLALLAADAGADRVRLASGATLTGLARERGLTVEVRTATGIRTVPAADVASIEWDRPAPWLARPPEWPDEVDSVPDLDVTCIEILPRPAYVPAGRDRRESRAPAARVTYVAHVVNRGTAEVRGVAYLFRTDRDVLDRGAIRTLAPGKRLTVSAFGAASPPAVSVTFEVFPPPRERHRELSAENNRLTVRPAAREIRVVSTDEVRRSYLAARNMAGSFSLEDYVQVHVGQANLLLEGTGLALRVGRFDVEGEATPAADPSGALRFFGEAAVTRAARPESTDALGVDWDLVRRLVSQLGPSDPRPLLPPSMARAPAFLGLFTARGAAPLSPFHTLALKAFPPALPSERRAYLEAVPARVVLRLRLPGGKAAVSARLVDPARPSSPRTLASGSCAAGGAFALPRTVPWRDLARRGTGWYRVAAKHGDGDVWGDVSLLALVHAWLRGERDRAVIDVACRE